MKQMAWYDRLQYGALLLLAAVMPVGWRYALWVALLLALVSLVKLVSQRRVGNPALSPALRWMLCAPVAYWLVLAASLLWSTDLAAGWEILRLKAVLLIFPLCFLLTDTSCLSRRHLRVIAYVFLAATCAAFLYFLVRAGIDMVQGGSFKSFNKSFNKGLKASGGVYHHAYVALYALAAILFAYHELESRWSRLAAWHRGLLIAAVVLLCGYIVVVNSRAGILTTVLVFVCFLLHQAFRYRRWWQAAVAALLLAAGGAGLVQLVPRHQNRIVSTVQKIQEKGDKGDARIVINKASAHAYARSPWIGYGVGDYLPVFLDQCRYDNTVTGRANRNAHNQYMESLLAAGIPGLLVLLWFLLAPLRRVLRSRNAFALTLAMGVVLLNLLFESMLERQMGLLFIGFLYAYIVLVLSVEENKFVQLGEK